jgi:hypothetical protein
MRFASAAYGWQAHIAFSPVLGARSALKRLLNSAAIGNLHALMVLCNVPEEDVIDAAWDTCKQISSEKEVFLPAHFLAIDRKTESVVFTIRGTMSIFDVITDANAEYGYAKLSGAGGS